MQSDRDYIVGSAQDTQTKSVPWPKTPKQGNNEAILPPTHIGGWDIQVSKGKVFLQPGCKIRVLGNQAEWKPSETCHQQQVRQSSKPC